MADGFEYDPAADFLAREQTELGDLGDDLGFTHDNSFSPNFDHVQDNPTQSNGPVDDFSAIRIADAQRAEPEKIRLWRIEFQERIQRKDSEEETRVKEWREVAAKELEDWHRRNQEQIEKTRLLNREQEAVFVRERDDTDPGLEWERVARLCEFNPKHCKQQRDVSRMRSILLQLKTQPLNRG